MSSSSSLPPQTRAAKGERLESFDVTEAMLGEEVLLVDHDSMSASADVVFRTRSRPIPVPARTTPSSSSEFLYPPTTASAASSQGSSGSAFLSQVLNSHHSNNNSNNNNNAHHSMLAHTPPTQLGTSYENAHFAKRQRSGSVSGRLRSASDYLEEKGLLDRQTKGILKDLIIIGDEELQVALDCYEEGDPSQLEDMIQSGALQNRLPQDLDILGDLDLDFLTMDDDDMGIMPSAAAHHQNIEPLPDHHHHDDDDDHDDDEEQDYEPTDAQVAGALHAMAQHQQHGPAKTITPSDDIGMVGDLEFAGEFVSDHESGGGGGGGAGSLLLSHGHYGSKEAATASSGGESPPDGGEISEFEKRMRSNSLFSALLDKPSIAATANRKAQATGSDAQYGQWMDPYPPTADPSSSIKKGNARTTKNTNTNRPGGITINKPRGRPKNGTSRKGGLAASLEADQKRREREDKKRERQEKKEKKQQEKKAAAAAAAASAMDEDDDSSLPQQQQQQAQQHQQQHIPGSGHPHSLDDPLLHFSIDADGLQQCERPDGWIGAYSPDSRRVRMERFMAKRPQRVWTKTVKYDVRKNFADSRLRVKGRFVKKEDELMMRELMSLT